MPILPSTLSITVQHTADLSDSLRAALRAFLDEVYADDFADEDWDHALGGLHTLAFLEDRLVGHAALVQRAFVVGDQPCRVGYVEAMGVLPAVQRRGIGRALMDRVNVQIARGYDLGVLSASDQGLGMYRATGWVIWSGPLRVMTPSGACDTPEEVGGVLVYAGSRNLDMQLPLICDYRSGDVW